MTETTLRRVTFLLTDVEGSTGLWERQAEAMRAALARHDEIVVAAAAAAGGAVVKARGEGDSQFVVFDDVGGESGAGAAVRAALSIQRALRGERWPEGVELRVRIAIHDGEAEARDGDYYGPTVNRCARLRAIAHGGQTILSAAAADRARIGLAGGASLEDLGLHRLKDLERPERVFELRHPELRSGFPPLRSLDARRHNLPIQSTRFIGREKDVEAVKGALRASRLVTLTGAGGCGKTRLALQVAADVADAYPDGVRLVELAPVTDATRVPQAVAAALGLREAPGRTFLETIEEELRGSRTLLVVDNCEHMVGAVASTCDGLLKACPGLRVLATSREGIGVPGEASIRVASLVVPPDEPPSFDALAASEAVRLFVDRAAAYRPGFALTRENAAPVAEVCRRLDGIPLALELAAARVPVLSPEQIAARLGDRFRLLTGGSRSALPRQQTLRAAFDWSHDLLTPAERAVLRRLSVFAGGFGLDAAEAVAAGDPVPAADVLDLVGALVSKSLVVAEFGGRDARFGMLETVRQYAGDRLVESGESAAVRDRHRDRFRAVAESAGLDRAGLDEGAAIQALEPDRQNFRAALEWSLGLPSGGEPALAIAAALGRFYEFRGRFHEGRGWLERAISAAPEASAALRADARHWAGALAIGQGDAEAAESHLLAALDAHRRLGASGGTAGDLLALGQVREERGDGGGATAAYEECLAIQRASGDEAGTSSALNSLGGVALHAGDVDRAAALFEESLALRRGRGDLGATSRTLNNLAIVATQRGDHAGARALLTECVEAFRRMGDVPRVALTLQNLGYVSLRLAEPATAAREFVDAAAIYRDGGHRVGIAECVEGLARAASAVGDHALAVRRVAAADAYRASIGRARFAEDEPSIESVRAAARAALGAEAYARAESEGRSLTPDEALA